MSASALFRRRLPEPLTRQLAGQVAAGTFVTVGELTKWTIMRHWGPSMVARLQFLLDSLLVLPYDTRAAARWANCRRMPSSQAGLVSAALEK
jgi:toxin FitB